MDKQQPYSVVIDLLRHGQPTREQCLLGSTDCPLSAAGWQQLHDATQCNPGWTQIISSPLKRCADFATELSKNLALPLTLDKQWQEIDFGEWDGLDYPTLHQNYPQALSAFWQNPRDNTPPAGESLDCFDQRLQSAWQALLSSVQGGHILLVTHSGVIRRMISYILEIPACSTASMTRIQISYATLCRIEVYIDQQKQWPRLLFLGTHN